MALKFHPTVSHPISLHGSTLIVPIVSTANLAQLAADLLVSSLDLDRIGILDSDLLLPVVGGREANADGVTTPLELYGKQGSSFYVVQQRSPVIKSCKHEFVKALTDFIVTSKFSAVLFLAGVDLSHRIDAHMNHPTYYLLPPSASSEAISSSPLKGVTSLLPPFTLPSSNPTEVPTLPSSGLTPLILRSLPSNFPPTATLLQYVLEGDNRPDAFLFATIVARVIGINEEFQWKEPGSWNQGLFGTPHDQTLFG